MGVEYRAAIVVGLPFSEVPKLHEKVFDDGLFELFGPYLDTPPEDSLVGYALDQSGDYSWTELELDPVKLEQLMLKFKVVTGLVAKLYLTPVWW